MSKREHENVIALNSMESTESIEIVENYSFVIKKQFFLACFCETSRLIIKVNFSGGSRISKGGILIQKGWCQPIIWPIVAKNCKNEENLTSMILLCRSVDMR